MKQLPSMESQPVRMGVFLVLLVGVTAVFFGLISNFLMACFWSSIFAILFSGVYKWLVVKFGDRPSLAAFTTSLIILFSVVIPIGLISLAVFKESKEIYSNIEQGSLDPSEILHRLQERLPGLERTLRRVGVEPNEFYDRVESMFASAISSLGESMWRYTQGAIKLIVDFFLILYLTFFLVRDGDKLMLAIRNTLPMGNRIEDMLFKKFVQVSRATLKGTVIVASCQGLIGGILFAAVGINGAVLWGVLMGLLSLLPVGGSSLVWVPAAVIMFVQGFIAEGIIIVVVGALGIGLIDNLLRPLLVARETQMPDYLILLATLGGLTLFGLSGFIIGPVIAALFLICWGIAGELFGGREG